MEAVAAQLDEILSDRAEGRVRRLLDVHDVEGEQVAQFEVEEHIDGDGHQITHWLVHMDEEGGVLDVDRLTEEELAGGD